MALYRFDQIAANITVRVEPSDTDLERYVGLEHLDPESLKLRRWGSPADVIGQKLKFWKGDIIYGKRRAYQRKLAVADFDGICSAHAMVLRAKQDVILPELLPFFLQSEIFHQRAMEISVGSLSPTINWSTLAKQEFPLPPVDEQRRIAELLWAADDSILRQEELILATLNAKVSLRQEFLSKGISVLSSTTKSKSKPSTWAEIPLRDACVAIVDCPHTTPNVIASGVLVLRNFNIKNGKLLLDDPSYTTEEEYLERIRRLEPKPGDVVFSREAPLGEATVIPENMRISLGQRTMMFRPKQEILMSQFLVEYIYAPKSQQKLFSLSIGTTASHVNVEDMRSFLIKLPPIEEQKEMVKVIQSFDVAVSAAEENLKNLKNVKSQILNTYLA
jgi:type I restriction enzyme, S subunit